MELGEKKALEEVGFEPEAVRADVRTQPWNQILGPCTGRGTCSSEQLLVLQVLLRGHELKVGDYVAKGFLGSSGHVLKGGDDQTENDTLIIPASLFPSLSPCHRVRVGGCAACWSHRRVQGGAPQPPVRLLETQTQDFLSRCWERTEGRGQSPSYIQPRPAADTVLPCSLGRGINSFPFISAQFLSLVT